MVLEEVAAMSHDMRAVSCVWVYRVCVTVCDGVFVFECAVLSS